MASSAAPVITFSRVVSRALEDALGVKGPLAWLLQLMGSHAPMLDVQLRADGQGRSWVSAYLGLTKVLDVHEARGLFRLDVHDTHAKKGGFSPAWATAQSPDALATNRPAIEAYLSDILTAGAVDPRYTGREGRVQSLISTTAQSTFGVLQREAVPAFQSEAIRDALTLPLQQQMWDAVAPQPNDLRAWWPTVRNHNDLTPRLGLEADLLGWDDRGRLLVIEVKPADALEGIAWAPAQARMYAEVFALWLEVDPQARASLAEMAAQRARLGLPSPSWALPGQPAMRVAPIIAIGDGNLSPQALTRLKQVHAALQTAPSLSARLDPLEVWHFDDSGACTHTWLPGSEEPPP